MAFVGILLVSIVIGYQIINPQIEKDKNLNNQIQTAEQTLSNKQQEKNRVENILKQLKNSFAEVQKRIYAPVDSDLGNDTLFFTLYSDVIEMVHANSIKIKNMSYNYNPGNDIFVKNGKDRYFVCELDMELVSDYVKLGKLIQDLYQYPYYIKINNVKVKPYVKDKKILLSTIKLSLYAHTAPVEED